MASSLASLARIRFLWLALGVPLAGCTEASGDAASPTLAPATPPAAITQAPAARRTVEVRNPFGNTKVAKNLMADGDFELTGRYDQQPWLAFGDGGQSVLNFETGGLCPSGIRCLVLTPGEVVLGWMATPRDGRVTVSLWAKPEGGACKDLVVQILDVDNESSSPAATITAPERDETGACRFEGTVPSIPGGAPAVWLEVDSKAKVTRVVVDDVVALPAEGVTTRGSLARETKAPARLPAVADWLRRHRRFGLPPTTGPENPPKTRREVLRGR